MAKYSKGSKIDFRRNALVCGNNISVCALVTKGHESQVQQYVVENEYGWTPEGHRLKQYGLDAKKKYLFASEHELSAPGSNAAIEKKFEAERISNAAKASATVKTKKKKKKKK